jgi:rod shape determining protein RodA
MAQTTRQYLKHFDWVMLLLLVLISAMALTNLYSASLTSGEAGAASLFYKQLFFFTVGLGAICVIHLFEYQFIAKLGWILYVLVLLLLVYTRLFVDSIAGSQRWIDLGFFNLQPSEPAKLILILVLTSYYAKGAVVLGGYRLRDLIVPITLTILPFVLIFIQPDLGTALIVAIVFVSITLFVRLRWSTLAILSSFAMGCIFVGWQFLLKPYQRKRIETFLNPEADPANHGYQILQSKIAVGSGKLFGKGFLEGTQGHLHFFTRTAYGLCLCGVGRRMGFCRSPLFPQLLLFHARLGHSCSHERARPLWLHPGLWVCSPYFLAGCYQSFYDYGFFTGCWCTFTPVQLWWFLFADQYGGYWSSHECAHAQLHDCI